MSRPTHEYMVEFIKYMIGYPVIKCILTDAQINTIISHANDVFKESCDVYEYKLTCIVLAETLIDRISINNDIISNGLNIK